MNKETLCKPIKVEKSKVEVCIRFSVSRDKAEHIFKARDELAKAGISFDTGACMGSGDTIEYDWEFDWSLKGGVEVFFKRFCDEGVKVKEVERV